MKRIPLSGGRAFALVDDADYDELAQYRWFLNTEGYAVRNVIGKQGRQVRMHRQILGLTPGDGRQADHRNFNRLDNRRANLRTCTHAENRQHQQSKASGTSRFRGVSWDKARHKWQAKVQLASRTTHLGRFENELDAAIAAETYRRQHLPFAAPDAELLAALAQPEPLAVAA